MTRPSVSLLPIPENRKVELFEPFDQYVNEFASISKGTLVPDLEYHRELLLLYWVNKDRFPYFIISAENETIGFVLVNDYCEVQTQLPKFSIAEFYIYNAYQEKGFGKMAAVETFCLHKGYWEVRVQHYNKDALVFWRKAISEFTKTNFVETDFSSNSKKGKCLLFHSLNLF